MVRPYDSLKWVLDRILAVLGLLFLSPVLLAIWLTVRISMGKPALFTQLRPGRGGRLFKIYKFRSMEIAPSVDLSAPDPDRGRVTRLGAILRQTSLDELPELWNVLRGEMSFVGPRPLLVEYLSRYSSVEARRHEVRPGITGFAQVCGRNNLSWEERFKLDVYYVDHRSFKLDLFIVLRSLRITMRREGITAEGSTTMTPFQGGGEKSRAI